MDMATARRAECLNYTTSPPGGTYRPPWAAICQWRREKICACTKRPLQYLCLPSSGHRTHSVQTRQQTTLDSVHTVYRRGQTEVRAVIIFGVHLVRMLASSISHAGDEIDGRPHGVADEPDSARRKWAVEFKTDTICRDGGNNHMSMASSDVPGDARIQVPMPRSWAADLPRG